MKETKEEHFRRVAEARVNKIINMVRLLGNCSQTGAYAYTHDQVAYIFSALQSELDKARMRYQEPKAPRKQQFSLTKAADNTEEKSIEPMIVLALPDGSYLRAVAYEDTCFPAINVYWDHDGGKASELLCFAENNPERKNSPQICIGVYASDEDDTKYYAPYMAERNQAL
jgi:hypothetical protein